MMDNKLKQQIKRIEKFRDTPSGEWQIDKEVAADGIKGLEIVHKIGLDDLKIEPTQDDSIQFEIPSQKLVIEFFGDQLIELYWNRCSQDIQLDELEDTLAKRELWMS